MSARLRSRQRLRKGSEFDAVFRRGRRLDGALFLLVAAPNDEAVDRLGLAVSRRLGAAVRRNRARRLLREGFRRLGRPAGPALDLVVVPRAALAARGLLEVERELRDRVERARRTARPCGPGAAGPR
jgi:ribonuclease P protein component